MLEAYIAEHGVDGLGITVEDGFVQDGHHRVVAAIRLGISRLPVESKEDAQARWVRDHGYVDWFHRKFGDR
jgi:ParB-like chromosome segregation protein Spo0J